MLLLLPSNQILSNAALLPRENKANSFKKRPGQVSWEQFLCSRVHVLPSHFFEQNIIGLEQELLLLIHLPLTHASLPQHPVPTAWQVALQRTGAILTH